MRVLFCAALLLAGCYDPKPPSGAYTCGAPMTDGGVGACPDNLTCACGLCVTDPKTAACSFRVELASSSAPPMYGEHEPFDVTVTAVDSGGNPTTNFTGNVSLSSSWGDVCVGTSGCVGLPHTVPIKAGVGSATVQLNRETSPPQTATLSASAVGNPTTADGLKLTINAGVAVNPTTLVPALKGTSSFGFAQTFVGYPDVIKDANGWKMYVVGGMGGAQRGIGIATSSDGITFTPPAAPLISTSGATLPFGAATAYVSQAGTSLFFGQPPFTLTLMTSTSSVSIPVGYTSIATSSSPADGGPFSTPVATVPLCPNCASVDFPIVIADTDRQDSGGDASSAIMFFSATQAVPGVKNSYGISILRATATTGKMFIVDPGSALSNNAEERVIAAPRLLLDGTVLKMWYSFVPDTGDPSSDLNPCSGKSFFEIGYATSSDGYFWVRSPNNSTNPTLTESATSLLMGSAIPIDGVDPSNGIALYYSAYESSVTPAGCVTNGIGRAVLNEPQ